MIEIEKALDLIEANIESCKTEIIPIEKSLNRIIAEKITAKYPLPNFDNSAMDGYGVSLIDVGCEVEIVKTIYAGDFSNDDFSLQPRTAVKIMTGAKIPKGVNSVIPAEELASPEFGKIQLPNSIQPFKHIRKQGEDIQIDEVLISKGEKLNPYHIGVLASQGISHIKVFKKPRVTIFATGKELKMHYENLEGSQIYNTNSPTLIAKCEMLGAETSFIRIASDSKEDIIKAIQEALDSDLIISSGGISVGEADFTKSSFQEIGAEIIFEKVAIKPGKPTTFAKVGKTAILNLPGNPLAGMVNFEIFGKIIIQKLAGDKKKFLDVIECEILENIDNKKKIKRVVLGEFDGSNFKSLKKQSPGMVKPLIQSNGFIILDSETDLKSGAFVKFLPITFNWFNDFQKSIITSQN